MNRQRQYVAENLTASPLFQSFQSTASRPVTFEELEAYRAEHAYAITNDAIAYLDFCATRAMRRPRVRLETPPTLDEVETIIAPISPLMTDALRCYARQSAAERE
jgi:hypothetical protein